MALAGVCEDGLAIALAVTDAGAAHTVTRRRPARRAPGPPLLDLRTLDDGTLTATATQTDAAGNTGTGTLTATEDLAAPAVTVTSFPTVNTCQSAAVTLSGACEDGLTIALAVTDAGAAHTVNRRQPALQAPGPPRWISRRSMTAR